MFTPILRPILQPILRPIIGTGQQCFAYNFDGVDDRGVLANRAINVDADNSFEFWTGPNHTGVIIAQSISSSVSGREFTLVQTTTSDGRLELIVGGVSTTLITLAQGFKFNTRYGLSLVGTNFQLFEGGLSGTLARASTFTKGAAREPSALTIIGARENGVGVFAVFFSGLQYDVRINGSLWVMGSRDSATQVSTPLGNTMTLFNTATARWQQVACRT